MSDSEYTIRPARADDAEALSAMWDRMARQHRTYDAERYDWADNPAGTWRKHFLAVVDDPDRVCLAAVTDGGAVGYLMAGVSDTAPIWAVRKRAQIFDVWVDPAWRRRGVGRTLLARAFEELKGRGAREVMLRVWRDNEEAIALYQDLGMRCVIHEMYKRL